MKNNYNGLPLLDHLCLTHVSILLHVCSSNFRSVSSVFSLISLSFLRNNVLEKINKLLIFLIKDYYAYLQAF